VEIADLALEYTDSFFFRGESPIPADAELTCNADVNEQLSMKLVRHLLSACFRGQ